ncbi:regulator of G-protein signaling 2-like [Megalops cyprinoides]|uniref:regulator of G-protein signaling 2-like n=1 Tax=Megalops cyprinoides TaxID=118141 RepID=UPI001865013F|nr:regulator of G-protein signaling 2-like [Megalops cyprinoides]
MLSVLYLNQPHISTKMDKVCKACKNHSELSNDRKSKKKTWKSRLRYFLQLSSSGSSSKGIHCRLTVDEVNEWAQSLEKLLTHKYGKAAFQIFLKSEFCEENMEFWLACEDFRKIKSPSKLTSRANSIYEEFIKSKAPKEINLDFYTKDGIIQNLQMPTPSCFVTAQKKIYNLMENSSYPRFIDSEIYKDLHAVALGKCNHLRT